MLVYASEVLLALKLSILKDKGRSIARIYYGLKVQLLVDWYVWFWWYSRNLHSCHFGVIMAAIMIDWYPWFRWEIFGNMLDMDNFAVVYTLTSVEVGEGVTAKLESVNFTSSNVRPICLIAIQLVVVKLLYGIL